MFGKPNWFRPKAFGFGLTPVTWQGWAYTAGWAGLLAAPFSLFLMAHKEWEALRWLGAGIGLLVYDVRGILTAMRPPVVKKPQDDVLYIGPETGAAELATRKYDMRLR